MPERGPEMPKPQFFELESDLALMPRAEFRSQLRKRLENLTMSTAAATATATYKPAGFRTVSPYITVIDPDRFMAFARDAFGAEELDRAVTGSGGLNLTVRVNGEMMFFAGGPKSAGKEKVCDMRLWVPNVDEVYARAIFAGATSVMEPGDRPYGERNAGVVDPAGNTWWIATRFESSPLPQGFGTVGCYLLKKGAAELIEFLQKAFNVEVAEIFRNPDGGLMHAAAKWGDSLLEFGEKETAPSAFYVFVEDPDALYRQALAAGAKSIYPPADHPYGHRSGGVEDPFGNTWYLARDISATSAADSR